VAGQRNHSPPLLTRYEGNLQELPGGDSLIGWGQQPFFTLFDSRGRTVLDGRFVGTTSSYRVYAKKIPLKDGDYTMDHTALIYLMDRDGKFVAPFNLKRTPEEAAADLKRYL